MYSRIFRKTAPQDSVPSLCLHDAKGRLCENSIRRCSQSTSLHQLLWMLTMCDRVFESCPESNGQVALGYYGGRAGTRTAGMPIPSRNTSAGPSGSRVGRWSFLDNRWSKKRPSTTTTKSGWCLDSAKFKKATGDGEGYRFSTSVTTRPSSASSSR